MKNQLQKKLKFISVLILGFTFLAFHTYKTQVNSNSQESGWYNNIINILTYFPKQLSTIVNKENKTTLSDVYISADPNFKPVNHLKKDLFLLGGNWKCNDGWTVELKNLKSNEVLKKWFVKEAFFNSEKSPRTYPNAEVGNPILLPDSNLIIGQIGSFNLFKINKNSELIWSNHDYYIHHAMNLNEDGNIWACARKQYAQALLANGELTQPYIDDLIVLFNQKDGNVLFEKSVVELLKENNLSAFAFGMNGAIDSKESKYDPVHLNDIEPVLKSGSYQEQGEVWLSFRNTSTVMLYQPKTNEVKKVINADLIHQHDVDILNDSTISIFNNNSITVSNGKVDLESRQDTLSASQIVKVDLKTGGFTKVDLPNNLYSATEGLCEYLGEEEWFIEEQNAGKIHVFQSGKLVYSDYYEKEGEYSELPHWSRVYNNLNFLND